MYFGNLISNIRKESCINKKMIYFLKSPQTSSIKFSTTSFKNTSISVKSNLQDN